MGARDETGTEQELQAALDAVEAAYEQASAAIEAIPDPQQAYVQASVLRETVDHLVGLASGLRARMAERIRDAEGLSLAALAERIGVSKSRADQFMREAAKARRRIGVLTGWFLAPSEVAAEHQVAICGSRAAGTNLQVIDETIRTLGAFLTRFRCRVVHGPVGVGIETMTHIADHYRPPDLGAVTGIFGRPNLIRDADYVLVIGGGQGTGIEVDLAISMEKRTIPMPTSGGAAAHAYERLQRNAGLRRWMPSEMFTALATADPDEFTRLVEEALSVKSNDAGANDG